MANAKTPPVAFCPIRGYIFSYGQDSGVSNKQIISSPMIMATDADRCVQLMADA
jgi:hypothetical protein